MISGVSLSNDQISAACVLIRPERRSPQKAQRLRAAGLASTLAPPAHACRTDAKSFTGFPVVDAPSTAARTRSRKSTERAVDMIVGILFDNHVESDLPNPGSLQQFNQVGSSSSENLGAAELWGVSDRLRMDG